MRKVLYFAILTFVGLFIINISSAQASFSVKELKDGVYEEAYEHSFPVKYETKEFNFSNLSDSLTLEINQFGALPYSDIDSGILNACGTELVPTAAFYIDSKQSVLEDILVTDLNVIVAHEKPIQISWNLPANCSTATLSLFANEYDKGIPFRFPEVDSVSYKIGSNLGSLSIDGKIDEVDGSIPLYTPYWYPATGHPEGNVYFYAKDDAGNFYFAADIAIDNSDEIGPDWIALTIGEKKFLVNDADDTYGKCGFGLTSKVSYKHQTCELKIPKNEINYTDEISFILEYYGTGSPATLSPSSAYVGGSQFVITVTYGSSAFNEETIIYWDESPLDTTYVSPTEVTAVVPAEKIAVVGFFTVGNGSGIQNTFTVEAVPFFWYNSGADNDWGTLAGNWWTDAGHTSQAGALPTGTNPVITVGTVGTGPEVNLETWTAPASINATTTGISFTSAGSTLFSTTITGDATFLGSARYNGTITGDATFYDTSIHASAGDTVIGDAFFYDESINYASVQGNASFYDSSTHWGYVDGNACFVNAVTQNHGEVGDEITVCSAFTLTYTPGNNGSITGTTTQTVYENNDGTTVTAVPNNNYYFTKWSDDVLTASRTDTNVTENITVTANFEINRFISSTGSRPRSTNTPCPTGHLFSATTGKPCTSFVSNGSNFPFNPSFNTSPVSPTCVIIHTLRFGSRGEEVKCLQTKLNILADGIFGPLTKAAVILFQQGKGLVPDGIVGPLTRTVLGS